MEITRIENGGEVTLKLKGCLDTTATPEFVAAVEDRPIAASGSSW